MAKQYINWATLTVCLLLHPDLVDGIDDSSGLRGHRRSGISVLDSEQQGLSADGLKFLLSFIFRPARPIEV